MTAAEFFGTGSDFERERTFYVDLVRPSRSRLPTGWEARAVRREIGNAEICYAITFVTSVYPEIHDRAVSKLVIGRGMDIGFLNSGALREGILLERILQTPHMGDQRLAASRKRISELFERCRSAGEA